jgi:hypothetical protein
VADTGNNTIRKITAAGVVTIAGSPMSPGSTDGPGSNARFIQPGGIAVDDAGHLYVADTGNNTIRKITAAGMVSTIAGFPGSPGSADGTGSTARFTQPSGIAAEGADNLYVYVADSGNNTIRKAFFTECFPNLPDPVLTFTGTIDDTVNGQELTSYQIPVNNWADFPDALFTATPDLPACPLNKSSSRSLVNIFDEKGNYIDGFCALTKAADLQLISFSIARSQVPPASVYVEIADRRCIQYYRSPVIDLRPVASVARNVDSSITVQWTGAGTLQTAPAVTGPWQDVIEATSPYRLEPTGAALFGRIKR